MGDGVIHRSRVLSCFLFFSFLFFSFFLFFCVLFLFCFMQKFVECSVLSRKTHFFFCIGQWLIQTHNLSTESKCSVVSGYIYILNSIPQSWRNIRGLDFFDSLAGNLQARIAVSPYVIHIQFPQNNVGIKFLQPTFNKGSTSPLACHPAEVVEEKLLGWGELDLLQQ